MSKRPSPAELRSSLLEAGDRLRELREKAPADRGTTWEADLRSAIQTIHTLDAEYTAAEATEGRSNGPSVATGQFGETRSAGEIFTTDAGYRSFASAPNSGGTFYELEVRAPLTLGGSDSGGLFAPSGQPIAPRARQRRLFIRDLVSVQPTGLSSVPYIRETAADTNEAGADVVAEGAAKPEVTMTFEAVDAPVRKIAAWIPVTTEVIDDAPTLRGYIDNRLGYMLALREEEQVLNGPGTGVTLRGIRNTVGLQSQAYDADTARSIGLAIGKVEDVDGDADGIAMNPTDFWAMATTRHADQFDGGAGGNNPFGAVPQTLWGLDVVRTRSVDAGSALVGSWRLGATLFDRQQTIIRVGNQHSDFFTNNKVAILAEERVALAVHRPDFFVEVDLTAV